MAGLRIAVRAAPVPVAPAGIWFEAVDVEGFDVAGAPTPGEIYDPSFHHITYVWSVEGAPLAPYDAPRNMLPVWRDANRAYGKTVALFFPEPGTYTVTLAAQDRSGTRAEASHTITIEDADAVYAGPATICMSTDPGETWGDAPEGAQRISDIKGLKQSLKRTSQPTRLLFRRGFDYQGIALRIDRQRLSHIDAWGAGARPVLSPAKNTDDTMFALWRKSREEQFTVANIDFRGSWDAATETGGDTSSPFTWRQSKTPCHYAIWNCSFDGFERLDFAPGDEVPAQVLIGNTRVTNWRNYGFLIRSAGTRFALVGTEVAQHVEALHGEQKAGGLANNHGPVRIADCAGVYIGASDFFSRTGWSPLSGELADQPCLRLNTRGVRGRSYNLERIVCEGGYQVINMAGANVKTEDNPGNYLIDKAVLIGTAKTIGPFVSVDLGGTTLRNVLGLLPDARRRHSNRWIAALRTQMEVPGPGNAETPFMVYASTFLSLLSGKNRSPGDWVLASGTEAFRNATLENVLMAGPETGGLDLSAPLEGIAPRYRGGAVQLPPPERQV